MAEPTHGLGHDNPLSTRDHEPIGFGMDADDAGPRADPTEPPSCAAATSPLGEERWTPRFTDTVPLLLVGLMLAAFWIDMAAMRFHWDETRLVKFLVGITGLAETFGHGFGATLILISIWFAAPTARWAVPRIAVLLISAGALSNLLKVAIIARHRPQDVTLQVMAETMSPSMSVWETFGGWMPLWTSSHAVQSFPSAHAATAWSLAFGLAWLAPKARWWFFTLAVFACLQRVTHLNHFPSDVVAGALVAWVVALLGIGPTFISRWWEPREARWRRGEWPTWRTLFSTQPVEPAQADAASERGRPVNPHGPHTRPAPRVTTPP